MNKTLLLLGTMTTPPYPRAVIPTQVGIHDTSSRRLRYVERCAMFLSWIPFVNGMTALGYGDVVLS
jgi:hypothetical protein